ncbi:hypothetical protein BH24ACT5_BH24ACT5_22670 [soil metagenome]
MRATYDGSTHSRVACTGLREICGQIRPRLAEKLPKFLGEAQTAVAQVASPRARDEAVATATSGSSP